MISPDIQNKVSRMTLLIGMVIAFISGGILGFQSQEKQIQECFNALTHLKNLLAEQGESTLDFEPELHTETSDIPKTPIKYERGETSCEKQEI